MPELLKAILLGIVEGVTEFLPVSSTGHLLLCERWMGIDLEHDAFWKTFAVFIQIGAILSVVVYFRRRIMDLLLGKREGARTPLEASMAAARAQGATVDAIGTAPDEQPDVSEELITSRQRLNAIVMILLATLPVLVVGFLVHDWIDQNLGSKSWVIAVALLVGAVAMIVIELLPLNVTTRRIEHVTWKQAVAIGLAQILAAVFPGTSRSAATILGGLLAGLSRPAAAEFSFFLAIPAMFAACGYSLLKWVLKMRETGQQLPMDKVVLLLIGTLVSFLVAYAVIAVFMSYIKRHTFIPFAVYRIVVGLIVLFFAR
jgi:undecaprenyl-diphosphatase